MIDDFIFIYLFCAVTLPHCTVDYVERTVQYDDAGGYQDAAKT